MTIEQESIAFIERLQKLYFEERDMQAVLSQMTPNVSWIGSGRDELCHTLQEAAVLLAKEIKECPLSFTLTDSYYEAQSLGDGICLVQGSCGARYADPAVAPVGSRISAVCVKTAQGVKLQHLHMSHADRDQLVNEFYLKQQAVLQREKLRDQAQKTADKLRSRESELAALTQNIPGGAHQCLANEALTIISMSDSFVELFGYSKKEIAEKFDNSFTRMIHPDDCEPVAKLMKEQLLCGDAVELEYRIRRKDGAVIWILDKGKLATMPDGTKTFFCVLINITEQRKAREALRLSLERHHVIMDQTTDIIFEWDILGDNLDFSSNWRKKFGYDPIQDQISNRIPLSANIHPADMPAFVKIMQDTAAGVPYSETEFRIRDILGSYTWCRIRATAQFADGRAVKAVGVIINIDREKKRQEILLEQARQDPLTGLLNKNAIKNHVEEHLLQNPGQSGVLLILDLDRFKEINDRFGHLCGDTVLANTAHAIKQKLSSSDAAGRVGGDEFMIFLPGQDEKQAGLFASCLIEDLRQMSMGEEVRSVACSIGSARYPTDGTDFYTLYRLADRALYHVKSEGKGGYAAYHAGLSSRSVSGETVHAVLGTAIESDVGAVDMQLAQYSFRLLYHAADIKSAVQRLLEIVGKAYDVSRVYIFENSQDGENCSNTFEWCAQGISSEMERLQDVRYQEDLTGYLEQYDQNGIFYCRDISETSPAVRAILAPQGIRSVLHCAITDDGVMKGFVGFDECSKNRIWTQEQINSLTLTANVLSIFLLKQRFKEQLEQRTHEEL